MSRACTSDRPQVRSVQNRENTQYKCYHSVGRTSKSCCADGLNDSSIACSTTSCTTTGRCSSCILPLSYLLHHNRLLSAFRRWTLLCMTSSYLKSKISFNTCQPYKPVSSAVLATSRYILAIHHGWNHCRTISRCSPLT